MIPFASFDHLSVRSNTACGIVRASASVFFRFGDELRRHWLLYRQILRLYPLLILSHIMRGTHRQGGPLSAFLQFGAMPLSISSLIALSFFDRCANPMPRNTFGALVN